MSKKTFSKLLSEKFQISRKKAEDLIKNKKVLLNDNIESRPYLVVQEKDIVSLNEPIEKKVNIILFHKPKGCITSRSDEKNRTIVYDYLPKKFINYHYIGRLDYNSEGLLLLTDSTTYKRKLESPKSNIKRVYVVNVIGSFNDLKLKALNQKIYAAKIYKNPHVSLTHTNKNKHTLRFELTEGKNREIRNICEIFNLKVERLKRISFGQYKVKSIPLSKYKEMTIHESY
jgi:23S rRNA pseudouridine2605 synthase